ncbi:hypothetical protein GGX14DRAFT_563314 [Mycena pura]|uniref:Uncharacterized protein n=1 Tax=Mycena pura TaxID=153505 RepID=A0AAD6YE48_9AGAR|nr:hypothetical protein GGX14DRAFT_563314 [Mycena pura]
MRPLQVAGSGPVLNFPPYTRGLFNTTTNVVSSLMISRLIMPNIRNPAKDLNGDSQDSSAEQWRVGVFSTYLDDASAAGCDS